MNIQDDLKSETRTLDRLQAERKVKMGKLEDELFEARKRGITGQALQGYQDRIDLYDGVSAESIEGAKARLEAAKALVDQQAAEVKQKAHAQLDALKEQAQAKWTGEGGSIASFEIAWPDMKAEILKARTLDALKRGDQGPASPALKISGL